MILAIVLLVGPWPVVEDDYPRSDYALDTFERVALVAAPQQAGPLRAGVASVDMTPPVGTPMAGYSARSPKANTGAREPVFAKALTLSNGHGDVTIVTGDYLLPLPQLVAEVQRRTGLARHQLYFAASHTHSGPGGYQDGLFAESALGAFDVGQLDRLAGAMAEAVNRSRQALAPVTVEITQLRLAEAQAAALVQNQLTDQAGYGVVPVLQVWRRNAAQPALMATLLSFSAHPTFYGKHNHQISADYPGVVQRRLAASLGGEVLFAAGAVGGMLPMSGGRIPAGEVEAQAQQVADMGQRLSDVLAANLDASADSAATRDGVELAGHWSGSVAPLASVVVAVDLPSPTFHLFEGARLSPLLVRWLFHSGPTYVHALRLGPGVMLGMPADYSGELAAETRAWAAQRGVLPWVTTFNGDYIGYVMPRRRYATPHYTTRGANAYGPHAGDLLLETSKRLIEQLFSGTTPPEP